MTRETTELVSVEGDDVTVPLIVWRRFKRPMPGLVERIYDMNPGLADLGPVLPYGTGLSMPVPIEEPVDVLKPITLW